MRRDDRWDLLDFLFDCLLVVAVVVLYLLLVAPVVRKCVAAPAPVVVPVPVPVAAAPIPPVTASAVLARRAMWWDATRYEVRFEPTGQCYWQTGDIDTRQGAFWELDGNTLVLRRVTFNEWSKETLTTTWRVRLWRDGATLVGEEAGGAAVRLLE